MSSDPAPVAAVIGWPIGHSLSPVLHGQWLAQHGLPGHYAALAVAPDDLARAMDGVCALRLAGLNVTVPHKEAVMAHLDQLTDHARRIGAVNTVIRGADGRLTGDSTDGFGFLEALREGAPLWAPADTPTVMVGAGGAARAMAVALLDAGVPGLTILNRSADRARQLIADLDDPRVAFGTEIPPGTALLANATSLGMVGQPPLDLDLAPLAPASVVFDAVYRQLETPLLAQARLRGHVPVDGLGMLIHQGRPGFAAWFGTDPTVSQQTRRALLAAMAR